MNSRQRFLKTMNFDDTDRVPLFKEGIREGVLDIWRKQGLPANASLSDFFSYDKRVEIALNLENELNLPKLANLTNGLDILQENQDTEDINHLPERFYQDQEAWRIDDPTLMLEVHHGFFLTLGIMDWKSFAECIYMLMDKPVFVYQVMQLTGEFAASLTKKVLDEIEIDGAIFSEPIGGNHGSLISLEMYRKFVASSYQPIVDVLNQYGVNNIIARTYANTREILPALFEAGINCLWACECSSYGMDYQEIRRVFGNRIRLIGGLDLDFLRQGKEQIRQEMERRISPLLEQGGYIPLLDGRVRADISFEDYSYYRQLLEKIVQG
jgi:hypothetical protein